jgi:DmsE family decaheme c-type cytochrome
MRRLRVFAAALLASSLLALVKPGAPSSQPEPTYVGTEACAQCHQQEYESFRASSHGRAEQDAAVVAQRTGCESCHGPGSLHAAAAGDRSNPGFATIRNLTRMPADQAAAVCTTCHRAGEQFYWDQSMHARRGVSCVSCHSVHAPKDPGKTKLLRSPGTVALCLDCHKNKRTALARTAHMPLTEGGMDCASCHNPHGAPGPRMVRAASVNELCTGCHADKRGPFLWEHAPVRESCLNCHEAHGSNNARMLAGRRPFLCQRCHMATRHPGTLYDLPDLTNNRLANRACNNCHSQIHGSNHPSGKFFLR